MVDVKQNQATSATNNLLVYFLILSIDGAWNNICGIVIKNEMPKQGNCIRHWSFTATKFINTEKSNLNYLCIWLHL